jgi:UDP-N-acetylglucosamine 3-dehydrogenase
MGRNHVRVLRELGCDVVMIDPDPAAGADFEHQHEAPEYSHAVIATPIDALAHEAGLALRYGADVLVEKPMASSLAEAVELVATAEDLGRLLFVGYTETFNPAVRALDGLPLEGPVTTRRIGGPAVDQTVGATLDLLVHDVAVLRSLGLDPAAASMTAAYADAPGERSLTVGDVTVNYRAWTGGEPLVLELEAFLRGEGFSAREGLEVLRFVESL